jgi:choline dehydrogenase-like flavoprotein
MDDGPGGAGRITGVDVRTLDGTALRVTARAYVLATGGIENARLLLASTDRDPAGVANGRDQVGRHFCDHLQIYAGFGVLEADEAELAGYRALDTTVPDGRHAGFAHAIRYGLTLSDEHLRDTGTTGLELLMAIGPYPGPAWRQVGGAGIDDVAAALRAEGGAPAAAVYVQGLAEQELDPDSRITLGDDTDALGMRRVRIDWRYGPDDRARILAGLRVMAEEIGALGWGRLQLVPGGVGFDVDGADLDRLLSIYSSDPAAIDPSGFPIGIGYHHMCTTRMAADPAEGVVDGDCRVHELDNLWVAGSSVFATPGTATPTYTIVALAIRLADHLREALGP